MRVRFLLDNTPAAGCDFRPAGHLIQAWEGKGGGRDDSRV